MKLNRILWLLASVLMLAACADNGIDDSESDETDSNTKKTTTDYIKFSDETVRIKADDEVLYVTVYTNLDDDDIVFYHNSVDMFGSQDETENNTTSTRAGQQGLNFAIKTNKNPNKQVRHALLVAESSSNEEVSDTIIVEQEGTSNNVSDDTSADGKVDTLLTHSEGAGIPIVLMGDGFGSEEIKDGTYLEVMNTTKDYLFSEEPMKSLMPRFDVYVVYAVSENNNVGPRYKTAFSTEIANDGTTTITGDEKAVNKYASKAVSNVDSAHIAVILNSHDYAGVTYFYEPDKDQTLHWSLSYCPVIDSLKSEYFRTVLVHEVVGHGIGKLADEYSYEEQGAITKEDSADIADCQPYNYYLNVSISEQQTPWDDFLNGSYCADWGEDIGVYSGGFTYISGVWRPTEESMMNSNNYPFNAPSRKALYDMIMTRTGGKASDYDSFCAWDSGHRPDYDYYKTANAKSRSTGGMAKPHFAPPRTVKHTR